MIYHCGLKFSVCTSEMADDIEHLFMCFFPLHMSSSVKHLLNSLGF